MCAKVLLVEFNEICPTLLDQWMGAGELPNFRWLYEESSIYVSQADETNPVNLEPWIQWYSIHTGLPFEEHGVFHLTDGPRAGHMDLWRVVQQAGKVAMNCGSMNARGFTGDRAFFLPDPWCMSQECCPPQIGIYAKVVATAVQEYSSSRVPFSWADYRDFLLFLIRHSLSPATVSDIVKQLLVEKLSQIDVGWKRVALLDRLQYDLFAHYYYSRLRPDFATFFSNSTAHLQHAYWRYMDPAPFAIKPSEAEQGVYGDAVLYGYKAMDRLIGRFRKLIGRDTVLILCSALSQQPFLKWEQKGGQHFYRLRDVNRFLAGLGASPVKVEPVMTHQYLVRFSGHDEMRAARVHLDALAVDGEPVCGVSESAEDSLKFGCQIFRSMSGEEDLTGMGGVNRRVRFDEVFYPIQGTKSGCHHPEGVLWISAGQHCVHPEPVSILEIAPTVCRLLQIEPGPFLERPFSGKGVFAANAQR